MKKLSYEGEDVSVGIDVHKNHYTVCCISSGCVILKMTTPADPVKLLNLLSSRFSGSTIRTAYEAGFSGFHLHRVLIEGGISNLVVNAVSIEVASRDRVKTDRRDSFKLASLLDCGRLKGIRVPTEEQEQNRLIHRAREQILKDRSRVANRLKMKLYQFNQTVPNTINQRRVDEILCRKGLPFELNYVLRKYISQWKFLNGEIKELDNILKKRCESDPLFGIYNSIPGFGILTCSIISSELGDMSQFPNEGSLFSFLGLTPTEKSSGDREIKGHISRQGSARIRKTLVEAAWVAITKDEYWKSQYKSRIYKLGGKKAIVAIARRLAGVARALAKSGELYKQPELKEYLQKLCVK